MISVSSHLRIRIAKFKKCADSLAGFTRGLKSLSWALTMTVTPAAALQSPSF